MNKCEYALFMSLTHLSRGPQNLMCARWIRDSCLLDISEFLLLTAGSAGNSVAMAREAVGQAARRAPDM